MRSKTTQRDVVLITGASRGLGRAIAEKLADEGYCIVINYRKSHDKAEKLAGRIGNGSFIIQADVGIRNEVRAMRRNIEKRTGRLDAVINNAGITKDNLLLRQTEEEWDEIISTNLKGCFNIIQEMTPLLAQSGGGHIINISSYSGLRGKAGQSAYSASKAALIGLAFSAAREFADKNIRVNTLLPGYLQTEMGKEGKKALEIARETSIMKTLSSPEEVAALVACLLRTERVTGQLFSFDSRII